MRFTQVLPKSGSPKQATASTPTRIRRMCRPSVESLFDDTPPHTPELRQKSNPAPTRAKLAAACTGEDTTGIYREASTKSIDGSPMSTSGHSEPMDADGLDGEVRMGAPGARRDLAPELSRAVTPKDLCADFDMLAKEKLGLHKKAGHDDDGGFRFSKPKCACAASLPAALRPSRAQPACARPSPRACLPACHTVGARRLDSPGLAGPSRKIADGCKTGQERQRRRQRRYGATNDAADTAGSPQRLGAVASTSRTARLARRLRRVLHMPSERLNERGGSMGGRGGNREGSAPVNRECSAARDVTRAGTMAIITRASRMSTCIMTLSIFVLFFSWDGKLCFFTCLIPHTEQRGGSSPLEDGRGVGAENAGSPPSGPRGRALSAA